MPVSALISKWNPPESGVMYETFLKECLWLICGKIERLSLNIHVELSSRLPNYPPLYRTDSSRTLEPTSSLKPGQSRGTSVSRAWAADVDFWFVKRFLTRRFGSWTHISVPASRKPRDIKNHFLLTANVNSWRLSRVNGSTVKVKHATPENLWTTNREGDQHEFSHA